MVLLAPLVVLVGLELGLRLLQNLGALPRYAGSSLTVGDDATNTNNARLVRSDDPVLGFEFDRTDPLINGKGTRGPEFSDEKPAGTFRIAVLGDSVAFGLGVPVEDTFAMRLQELLRASGDGRRVEVLNFGVNGYGTVEELHLYEKRVKALSPDLVLVSFVLNDPFPPKLMMNAVADRIHQVARVDRVQNWSQLAAWILVMQATLAPRLDPYGSYERLYTDPEIWSRETKAVQGFASIPRGGGPPVAVVLFPLLVDYARHGLGRHHERMHALLDEAGLPWLDLRDAYAAQPLESLRQQDIDDTHPNPLGHRLAAESLAAWLPKVVPALRPAL